MNLEERAEDFIEEFHKHSHSPIDELDWDVVAKWMADFASEAVKAERERIADELDNVTNSLNDYGQVFKGVLAIIDRLRGERE